MYSIFNKGITVNRSILFFLFVVATFSSCKDKQEVDSNIDGVLRHGQGYWLYLEELGVQETLLIDSVQLTENGKFHFGVKLKENPQFYFLRLQSNEYIRLLVDKGENIDIQANALHMSRTYVVSNSPGSRLLWELKKMTDQSYSIRDSIYLEYRSQSSGSKSMNAKTDSILKGIYHDYYSLMLAFVDENPKSLATIFALYAQFDDQAVLDFEYDFATFKKVALSLVDTYPESTHAQALMERVESKDKKEDYRESRERLLKVGSRFPQIQSTDLHGLPFSLNEVEGAVSIVYFWQSTNADSWHLHAELKKIWSHYESKGITILGVAMEKDKLQWKNTVALDQLEWAHIIADPKMQDDYNLKTLPRVFILDAEKKILYKDVPKDSLSVYVAKHY